jgi:hypothetical protein
MWTLPEGDLGQLGALYNAVRVTCNSALLLLWEYITHRYTLRHTILRLGMPNKT